MNLTFRTDAFEDAAAMRRTVFMEEQGFQSEFDNVDEDPRTIHLTAYDEGGRLVACARVFPSELEPGTETVPGKWVFGRLATQIAARGNGIGSAVLAEAERLAREAGGREMHLHAQCSAQPLYVRAGYAAYGPIELDEHVEHQWMEKDIRE
ncbi:MAG: GNAT family N-acetyltransferase [Eggerthellaceae bacterium]|nr:GNAT family N-acetyltransferase [Eggerthellaceae bacterium]